MTKAATDEAATDYDWLVIGSGFGGSNLANAFGPPLRFSARARMDLNGMVMR